MTKKRKGKVFFCLASLAYGFFLSISNANTAPTTMITIMIAIPRPKTYVLVFDAGAGVGELVAEGAFCTTMVVCALDP